jgi:Mrp family chromosome partitioning ATPase
MISPNGQDWHAGDSSHWLSDPQFREACLRTLGKFFHYILLDCSSISTCAAAVGIAPLVDGVVLVVQAGRTSRRQIKFAQEFLHLANAKILGYVLNKREYPIPEWLHARL